MFIELESVRNSTPKYINEIHFSQKSRSTLILEVKLKQYLVVNMLEKEGAVPLHILLVYLKCVLKEAMKQLRSVLQNIN